MAFSQKRLRYYYWLLIEFIKRHLRMILLSFFLSFFIVVSLISFSPILNRFLFTKKEIVGLVGNYNLSNVPVEVLENISHGLVFTNERGQVHPALASSWEIIDGGQTFQFRLKNDLVWDDGKELLAKDIKFNFKDVEVKALDERTLQFKLQQKLPIFPTYLTQPLIKQPLHGVAGPYKVDKVKMQKGILKEILLSPNKNNLPLLIYKFFDSENKLIHAYKTGSITKMTLSKKSLADTFKDWKNTKITRNTDYSRVMTLFFNLNDTFLAEKGVREAITLSIPKKELDDHGELATGPISPVSWAYNPNLKQTLGDADLAKKNLEKYLAATPSAKLDFVTFFDNLNTASKIDENFKTIGLPTNLSLGAESLSNFDILLAFWKIPTNPDQYLFWHSTQVGQKNITAYKNVKIDKLLEDARSTLDVSKRREYYFEFQRVIISDLPAAFIYYPYVYTIERR